MWRVQIIHDVRCPYLPAAMSVIMNFFGKNKSIIMCTVSTKLCIRSSNVETIPLHQIQKQWNTLMYDALASDYSIFFSFGGEEGIIS